MGVFDHWSSNVGEGGEYLYALVMESWVRLTILYCLNCAQNLSARARVPSNTAGGIPRMPPFDGVGRAAVAAAPPPPPPPLPPLHPPVPVALADMGVVC